MLKTNGRWTRNCKRKNTRSLLGTSFCFGQSHSEYNHLQVTSCPTARPRLRCHLYPTSYHAQLLRSVNLPRPFIHPNISRLRSFVSPSRHKPMASMSGPHNLSPSHRISLPYPESSSVSNLAKNLGSRTSPLKRLHMNPSVGPFLETLANISIYTKPQHSRLVSRLANCTVRQRTHMHRHRRGRVLVFDFKATAQVCFVAPTTLVRLHANPNAQH